MKIRTERGLAYAVAVAWLLCASAVAAGTADLDRWRDLRWGARPAEIGPAFAGSTPLAPPWDYGPFTADRVVRGVEAAGIVFDAFPQIDRKTGVLAQLLLQSRPPYPGPDRRRALYEDLVARYGEPDAACTTTPAPGQDVVWRFPETVMTLSWFDFTALPKLTFNPYPKILELNDYLATDWGRLRNRPQRVLLRFTDAAAPLAETCAVAEP
jgi:hypothetical protein